MLKPPRKRPPWDGFSTAECRLSSAHTHVQTADERLLNQGTAYITDVGMTGSYGGVIGMKKGDIINRFRSPIHRKPDHSKSDVRICAAVVDVDEETGRARSIDRINLPHTS